jgi:hypothetical protein
MPDKPCIHTNIHKVGKEELPFSAQVETVICNWYNVLCASVVREKVMSESG